MKRKYLYIIGGLFFLFLFFKLEITFASGSYAYTEQYELNYPEKRQIKASEMVRKKNIYLRIGKGWEDKDTTDHWHHIYFNFHNKMLLTWTRPNEKNITFFAFVRMQDENSEWQEINNNFGYFENKKIKNSIRKRNISPNKNCFRKET